MKRYTLSRDEYFELLSHAERVAKLKAEAQLAIAAATGKQTQVLEALAVKYGFDPKLPAYQLNDETLELVALEAGPAPAP